MSILNINKIALYISILFILTGCGYTKLAPGITNQDIPYFCPEPFQVIYSYEYDQLNSVEGYIAKGLLMGEYSKAPFVLTKQDKIKIYNIVKDVDLSTYPDRMLGGGGHSVTLWIKYGSTEKTISWDVKDNPKNEKEETLKRLARVLREILTSSSSYQALPYPRGPAGRL